MWCPPQNHLKSSDKEASNCLDWHHQLLPKCLVRERNIIDNVMLAHYLVNHYKRDNISPRAMLKIDIRKAFDAVHWSFLKIVLMELGFPGHFVQLVMTYISFPIFSINVNGEPRGISLELGDWDRGTPSPHISSLWRSLLEDWIRLLPLRTLTSTQNAQE